MLTNTADRVTVGERLTETDLKPGRAFMTPQTEAGRYRPGQSHLHGTNKSSTPWDSPVLQAPILELSSANCQVKSDSHKIFKSV